ncbi:beta carbonic anhydrase 5, chloroplastic-like isoform X1 [Corylus avellana]|uniref:beta carbonic anhydrase 5, chloroplastic-like isoform X1 n=1 Tax=Corylus avellana TaxID=13451 RepID=UPI00286AA1B8|nr:beta carbonic anhydrase 5, chloroplastic-like isoform X1 [Corylus avellana]
MATPSPTTFSQPFNFFKDVRRTTLKTSTIFGPKLKSGEIEHTHLRLLTFFKTGPRLELKASKEPPGLTQQLDNSRLESLAETENVCDFFEDLKHRFLRFKKRKFKENLEHFQNLAQGQAPKFMIIACADSRVCPSNILGFQPGEAFVVRNIANLVPTFESGPSETNAALEFAVNALKVENILVIGHSRCGGIRALMSMQDEEDSSSFIRSWVVVGNNARLITKSAASNLSFDQQCRHCEKESVYHSLSNLLTYPWIEEKVARGELFVHGGYYDFVECTFEKWTMDYEGGNLQKNSRFAVKNQFYWC